MASSNLLNAVQVISVDFVMKKDWYAKDASAMSATTKMTVEKFERRGIYPPPGIP